MTKGSTSSDAPKSLRIGSATKWKTAVMRIATATRQKKMAVIICSAFLWFFFPMLMAARGAPPAPASCGSGGDDMPVCTQRMKDCVLMIQWARRTKE